MHHKIISCFAGDWRPEKLAYLAHARGGPRDEHDLPSDVL
jgi:hypothetical protein